MEPIERAAVRAPARPILSVALAAAGGSLAGASEPALGGAAALAACALLLLWSGWTAGWVSAGGAAPGRRERRGWIRPLGAHPLALAMVAALALARAAGAATESQPAREPCAGIWRARIEQRGELFGALESSPVEYQLPDSAARDGERVLRLAPAAVVLEARGPVEPRSRARQRRALLADSVVRLAPAEEGEAWWAPLRRRLLRACDAERDPELAALLRAAVCGDTSRLEPATADLFTRTGTRHMLAVSGQNVALITALCLVPFAALCARILARLLPARAAARVDAAPLVALLVFVYAPLAGGGSPVRRAVLACALALFARRLPAPREGGLARLGRRADALSLWGLALLLECLAEPGAAAELSLALSYAATLGLIVGTAPLARLLQRTFARPRPALDLGGTWPGSILLRATRGLRIAFAASLAASLATLPIAWPTFGELALPGAVATVAALPLFAALLAAGWVSALVPAYAPAVLAEAPARALLGLLHLIDALPGTPEPLPLRPLALIAAATLASFAALVAHDRGRRSRTLLAAACMLWATVLLPWRAPPARPEIWALDVGHGSAILVRANGERVWVFDCGSRDRVRVAQAAVAPLLARWEAGELGVLVSHSDQDHDGGIPWLLERFRAPARAGALTCTSGSSVRGGDWILERGSLRLPTRGPLALRLLRPRPGEGNEGSHCLEVGWGGQRALLCGDAVEQGLGALLAEAGPGGMQAPLALLLAPHHGSESPWLGRLLTQTAPALVWISEGGPAPALGELDRRGIPWRSTGTDGPLHFRFGESGFQAGP